MTVNFNIFFITKMFNTFFAVSVFASQMCFLTVSLYQFLQLFRNIKGDLYSLKP